MRNRSGASKLIWIVGGFWLFAVLVIVGLIIQDSQADPLFKRIEAANRVEDREKQLALFEQIQKEASQRKTDLVKMSANDHLISLLLAAGDFERGRPLLMQQLKIERANKDTYFQRITLCDLARTEKETYDAGLIKKQDPQWAIANIELCGKTEHHWISSLSYEVLIDYYIDRGDFTNARRYLDLARENLTKSRRIFG